jgi:hypothetical protein
MGQGAPARDTLLSALNAAGIAIDVRAERVAIDGYIGIADALTALGFAAPST